MTRPLPHYCLLPQVYQIISPYTSRLDNVLELYTGAPFSPLVAHFS